METVKPPRYRGWLHAGRRLAQAELAAVAALLVVVAGVIVFIAIADDITGREAALDQAVLAAMRIGGDPTATLGPDWLHRAAVELTGFGDTWTLIAVAAMVIGFLLIQRKAGQALLVALALGGGSLLSETLKALFARDRPPLAYRVVEVASESFPSGHAMLSAVTYLTLGVLLARVLPRRRLKAYVVGVAVLIALVVGLTRVYLGVHWLTDVVAGWCLGAAWAMACWLAAYAIERLRSSRRIADGPPAG